MFVEPVSVFKIFDIDPSCRDPVLSNWPSFHRQPSPVSLICSPEYRFCIFRFRLPCLYVSVPDCYFYLAFSCMTLWTSRICLTKYYIKGVLGDTRPICGVTKGRLLSGDGEQRFMFPGQHTCRSTSHKIQTSVTPWRTLASRYRCMEVKTIQKLRMEGRTKKSWSAGRGAEAAGSCLQAFPEQWCLQRQEKRFGLVQAREIAQRGDSGECRS